METKKVVAALLIEALIILSIGGVFSPLRYIFAGIWALIALYVLWLIIYDIVKNCQWFYSVRNKKE